ncbi:uncharacterized protein LOC110037130, partial [Phalaenopsis equestris]|uniref:uncharacterized protein LOC110037130 n=1 Tax=Phalaenopsis equestris TaxID=78828 RepID=UPI0009E244EB
VFVVGHDWGAIVAWNLCAFRPDKVKALVNLSVAFFPRKQAFWRIDTLRAMYGDDLYICRFQEPGEVEAQLAELDTALFLKGLLTSRYAGPFLIPKDDRFKERFSQEITLPAWLSEADIDYFATKLNKTGFTGGINYYRNIDKNWELTAPWDDIQIKVPTKFIVGDLDLAYRCEGMEDYIHKGGFKRDVPLLEDVVVMEGVGHFINQEKAEEISNYILDFIHKF